MLHLSGGMMWFTHVSLAMWPACIDWGCGVIFSFVFSSSSLHYCRAFLFSFFFSLPFVSPRFVPCSFQFSLSSHSSPSSLCSYSRNFSSSFFSFFPLGSLVTCPLSLGDWPSFRGCIYSPQQYISSPSRGMFSLSWSSVFYFPKPVLRQHSWGITFQYC